MRWLHERCLIVAGLLFGLAPLLAYAAFLVLWPALLCMLLSLWCGMAHLRQSFAAGTLGWRSHSSYGIVALFWVGSLALLVSESCFPDVDTIPLYLATALALLAPLYLVPFALVRWHDGRRWLPRRTAWGLLLGTILLAYGVWGATPGALPGAAAAGRWLSVRFLLALGHDVHRGDGYGRTALFRAAAAAHPTVVTLLLAHGANVNTPDNGGSTAFELLAYDGNLPMLKLLHAAGAHLNGSQALRAAASSRREAAVEWMLAQQAVVVGSGALEAAAAYADAAMVRRLLQHTPPPDRSHGLAESAARGDLESARLFLAHGADVNQPDPHGMTPLFRAIRHGVYQAPEATILALLDLLLASGADLTARTQGGDPVLVVAVQGKHLAVVTHLLARGAPVHLANQEGMTALGRAVADDNEAAVRVLLAAGATCPLVGSGESHRSQEAQQHTNTTIQGLLQQACP